MTKVKQSVFLGQCYNPKWDGTMETDEYVYYVEKTVNTLRVKIGQYISPKQVDQLIADGVVVTISKPNG